MAPHLLPFLLLLLSTSCLSGIESAATVKLTNQCPQTILPDILSGGNTPDLTAAAGSPLAPGKYRTIPVPTGWSGRISGRTICETSGARKVELSLDGGEPPATVVELTLDGAGGLEYSYSVSSVDGNDIPVAVLGPARGCSDELKATAARGKGEVACNDTSSRTAHTDYAIVFCPRPYSSGEVVGRRRGRAALPLVNQTTMTTAWPSRHRNGALSSAADIDVDLTEAATTLSPADHQESNGGGNEMMTTKTMAMEPVKMVEMRMMLGDKRRRLNSFQMCALCTCCSRGGSRHYCLLSPCCYAINCNIPNKPFGFCSFTPRACNCFGCHL
ncbi:unnamed protein product [Linum trigynum]|uniref:DUF7866 domain-containing protein n=1 Tax=Linum trigynum TaxID=586398 RepID=A0AAV2EHU6_9ROSI